MKIKKQKLIFVTFIALSILSTNIYCAQNSPSQPVQRSFMGKMLDSWYNHYFPSTTQSTQSNTAVDQPVVKPQAQSVPTPTPQNSTVLPVENNQVDLKEKSIKRFQQVSANNEDDRGPCNLSMNCCGIVIPNNAIIKRNKEENGKLYIKVLLIPFEVSRRGQELVQTRSNQKRQGFIPLGQVANLEPNEKIVDSCIEPGKIRRLKNNNRENKIVRCYHCLRVYEGQTNKEIITRALTKFLVEEQKNELEKSLISRL